MFLIFVQLCAVKMREKYTKEYRNSMSQSGLRNIRKLITSTIHVKTYTYVSTAVCIKKILEKKNS